MPFYIAPYKDFDNKDVNELMSSDLLVLFYKNLQGSFGINKNDSCLEIFFKSIQGATYYSIKKESFFIISDSFFNQNKFDFKGFIFINSNNNQIEIINRAKKVLQVNNKNKLLEKFNKVIVKSEENVIIDSYKGNFKRDNVEILLKNNNVILLNTDGYFGTYIVYNKSLNNKIVSDLLGMNNFDLVIKCNDMSEIPDW